MCLAYPYKIVEIKNEWTAIAEAQGVKAEIFLHLLPESVEIGDWVLVHVGFAIRKISEEDARTNLRYWDEILRYSESSLE